MCNGTHDIIIWTHKTTYMHNNILYAKLKGLYQHISAALKLDSFSRFHIINFLDSQ